MAEHELPDVDVSLVKEEPPESTVDLNDIPLDPEAENIPDDR